VTDGESRPIRSEQVLAQTSGDTVVLLHPDSGEYYTLDEVGARVWELCDGTRSTAELVEVLCREYDAPAETIRADVLELLAELVDEKLVVAGRG
jgi:hypothetical protein